MSNPGFDCLMGKHLFADIYDQAGACVGGWCLWCGTAVYDHNRIDDDGTPDGFVPHYLVRVPAGFHRRAQDT